VCDNGHRVVRRRPPIQLGPAPALTCCLSLRALRHARNHASRHSMGTGALAFPAGAPLISATFVLRAIANFRRLQSRDALRPRRQCNRSFHQCLELIPAQQSRDHYLDYVGRRGL
jgi:hypothetical protein